MNPDRRVSVAPMMDWTDRHCRFFLRGFARDTLLYTEMITSQAILRGDVARLLAYDPEEHPVALQLGGSDPRELAAAARIGADLGYDEINLNCGCPSDRVHSGSFGACLMLKPALVADCVAAMRAAVAVPVTVKLRIGVVDAGALEPGDSSGATPRESARVAAARFADAERAALNDFVDGIVAAGCAAIIVHARKAVLGAWSPRDNREIPPLRYDVVRDVQRRIAPVPVVLNGGLRTAAQVQAELAWADGVMLGREAYHRPMLLAELAGLRPTRLELLERMTAYARREMARGEKLAWIARHMLGLYAGQPGAKEFRRRLSEGARDPAAAAELLLEAGQFCERLDTTAAASG
jgi:tRNA-dihydrouridine synthase A